MKREFFQKQTKKIGLVVFAAVFLFVCSNTFVIAKAIFSKGQARLAVNAQSAAEKINLVNEYQEKYFEIVKRNNVLLNLEDTEALNKDRQDLENLFAEVEKQITNTNYLKKYKKIQKRFSSCDAITTIGINQCADSNYNAINNFVENIYYEIWKKQLKSEDIYKFAENIHNWRREVNNYEKIYESIAFGTIGTSIYYGFEINMSEFRALLLMLYL